jgi:hypothetical protein
MDLAEFMRGDSAGTGLIPRISDGIISVTLPPSLENGTTADSPIPNSEVQEHIALSS